MVPNYTKNIQKTAAYLGVRNSIVKWSEIKQTMEIIWPQQIFHRPVQSSEKSKEKGRAQLDLVW